MDNITHSLIGIGLGKTFSKKQSAQFQKAALWIAIIGSNIPDIDFLFPTSWQNGSLGYLLMHRGYTHTFLFSVVQALLVFLMIAWIFRLNKQFWKRGLFISLISVMIHILADYMNEYGVHPFFPVSNRWVYGDFIFIVEPLLWFSLLGLALSQASSKLIKKLGWGLGFVFIVLLWSVPYTRGAVAFFASLWGLVHLYYLSRTHQLRWGWVSVFSVLVCFFMASKIAQSHLRSQIPQNALPLQMVSSPTPGNPFCWRGWISFIQAGEYHAQLAFVSLIPKWIAPKSCEVNRGDGRLSPLSPLHESSDSALKWVGEFKGNLFEFRALLKSSCAFRSFLQFARLPFWIDYHGLKVAGDLRFDREKKLGFSKIVLDDSINCPNFEVPWIMPMEVMAQ